MDQTDEKYEKSEKTNRSTTKHSSRRLAKTAGTLDTKELGDLGELAFVLAASAKGLAVSKPYGDCRRYDLIVDSGRRLLRIQVKSVYSLRRNGSFHVNTARKANSSSVFYTADDIDFLAAYVAPRDIWYLIPVSAVLRRSGIRLHPDGLKTNRGGHAKYEVYREAWNQLDERINSGMTQKTKSNP